MPLVTKGLSGSLGMAFLLTVMPTDSRSFSASLPVMLGGAQVDEHEVVVGAAGDEAEAALDHRLGQRRGVVDDLLDVGLELGLQRLAEGDGLGGDDVLERAALDAGEDRLVERLGVLLLAQDDAAARTAQRLVRGGGDEVGVRHRRGVRAGGDEAGDVGHVDHEHAPTSLAISREALEVDDARVGAGAGDDHLGPVLLGEALDLVVVDRLGLGVQAVGHDLEQLAREVDRRCRG